MVIKALSDGLTHAPFRDSRLTRILTDSLGEQCLSFFCSHYLYSFFISSTFYFCHFFVSSHFLSLHSLSCSILPLCCLYLSFFHFSTLISLPLFDSPFSFLIYSLLSCFIPFPFSPLTSPHTLTSYHRRDE